MPYVIVDVLYIIHMHSCMVESPYYQKIMPLGEILKYRWFDSFIRFVIPSFLLCVHPCLLFVDTDDTDGFNTVAHIPAEPASVAFENMAKTAS